MYYIIAYHISDLLMTIFCEEINLYKYNFIVILLKVTLYVIN